MTELSLWSSILGHECDAHGEEYWGWVLHPLIMLYMFYLLAQICDGHLTTALEFIVEKFEMSEDVAGATFLAMASSAPELFCSIISTFVLVSASGVGNIVGSAVFNLLVIIGVTPGFAGRSLRIWWYPTMRDAAFYSMAIIEVFVFMFDGKVYWYESLVMNISYAGYVFYFTQNQRVLKHFGWEAPEDTTEVDHNQVVPVCETSGGDTTKEKAPSTRTAGTGEAAAADDVDSDHMAPTHAPESPQGSPRRSSRASSTSSQRKDSRSESKNSFTLRGRLPHESPRQRESSKGSFPGSVHELSPVVPCPPLNEAETSQVRHETGDIEEACQEEDAEESGWCKYEPIMFFINKTMPTRPEMLYLLFGLCCLWIAFFTYFAVDSAGRFGCLLSIPDVVMGLVILAAGTSVPDAMGSIAVAKDGMGDMAVANAVGSNTFDILLGLGLPWFLKSIVTQEPIEVPTDKLQEAVIILAGCLVFYLCAIALNRWQLTRNLGFALLLLYVLVITWFLIRGLVEF